jgi:PII-like signaling protein
MNIEGPAQLIEVYIGESDQWQGRPLAISIVERLKEAGIAGATVLAGQAGFGANSRIHAAHLLRLSEDLPLVIKIVDEPERAKVALQIVEEMVREGGLITVTDVRVQKCVSASAKAPPAGG